MLLIKNKYSNQKISTAQLLQNKQTKKQSSFQGQENDVEMKGNEQIASGLRIANYLSKGEKKKACIEAGVTTAKVAAAPVTVPAKDVVASSAAAGGGIVGTGIGAGIGSLLCPGLGTVAGAAIGNNIGLIAGGGVGYLASQKVENKVWEKTKKFLNDECVIM